MPLSSIQRLTSKVKNSMAENNAHTKATAAKSNDSAASVGSFICPQCMAELSDPNELQAHFSAFHNDISQNQDNDISTMRSEMNDLRASLKEEKWYSSELKKEVESLQAKLQEKFAENTIATDGGATTDEVNYYLQQINMLEAGKGLVTTQMMDLEKQSNELKRTVENLKRENVKLLEKSGQFSQNYAELMAKLDEESAEKTALTDNLQKFQEKLVDLEAQLNARPSEDDVIVLRKELVNAQTLMNDLTCDRESEAAKLRVKCVGLEEKCREFEEIVNELTSKIDKAPSSEEFEKLKKTLSETEEHYTKELTKMTNEKIMVTEETERLRASLSGLETQLASMTEKYEQFKTELSTVSNQFNDNTTHECNYSETVRVQATIINDMEKRLERQTANLRALNANHAVEKESLLKQCDVINNELERSQNSVNNLQGTVYDLNQKLEKELKINDYLKKQMTDQKKTVENQQQSTVSKKDETSSESEANKSKEQEEELKQEIQTLKSALDTLKTENLKANEEILKLRAFIDDITQRENDLRSKLTDNQKNRALQEEESGLAIKTLQDTVAELKAECLRLQQQLNLTMKTNEQETGELNMLVNNLEKNLDDLKKQRTEHQLIETELKAQIEKLNIQLLELEQTDSKQKDQMTIMTFDNATKQSVIDELTYEKEEVEGKFAQITKEMVEKQKTLNETQKECSDLKQRLQHLTETLNSSNREKSDNEKRMETEIGSLKEKLTILEEKSGKTEESLRSSQENEQSLLNENKKLKSEIDDKQFAYISLDAVKVQLESSLKDLMLKMENQEKLIASLQDEKAAVAKQCQEIKEDYQKKESDLRQTERDFRQYQTASIQLKCDLENECQNLKLQLENLEARSEESAQSHSSNVSKLQVDLTELQKTVEQVSTDYAQSRTELDTVRKELKQALQAKKDLEAQLSAWNDEKRMLLEKCLTLEKYLDEEKDNARELNRRFDDAVSAMHDLGRENQSMQIDISKHFNRKWADDNEVINCTACQKLFSYTIRKHHCRNCGLIFCNECSSKMALVVAAKKPVRVCDNCHTDLNNR